MLSFFTKKPSDGLCQIIPVTTDQFDAWQSTQPQSIRNWLLSCDFTAKAQEFCLIPDQAGGIAFVAVGYEPDQSPLQLGAVMNRLPNAHYILLQNECFANDGAYFQALLSMALAVYRYPDSDATQSTLYVPDAIDFVELNQLIESLYLVRHLINLPANLCMPSDLVDQTRQLAKKFKGKVKVTAGKALLDAGMVGIEAVGRVGGEPPCLIDLTWGVASNPLVTLVGKGVCFDTGGLSLKPSRGMRHMKKDMGGAAHALGLARMIMAANLPVSLRVLIPAVENGVGPGAYRLGDVLHYPNGTSVEVTNTDAEGRLVLADALLVATQNEKPDLLIDFATLTGAARVALGPDLTPVFATNPSDLDQLISFGHEREDLIWPMPLHEGYKRFLDSKVADCVNASEQGMAGCITAALFLQKFVPKGQEWMHFDIYAWHDNKTYGWPTGGDATGLRATYHWLKARYKTL